MENIIEELKDSHLVNEEPKEVRALRIATLTVLTLSPGRRKRSEWSEDPGEASATREHL